MAADVPMVAVVNWDRFQHYTDRSPPWIKLYNDLLDDYAWACLQDASKAHLMGLWLLASRMDNRIPADPEWLARRIGAQEPVDLDALLSAGFIRRCDPGPQAASTTQASRKHDDDLETEGETEGETETTRASGPAEWDGQFERLFWPRYPRRKGNRRRKEAMAAWRARRREGVEAEVMVEAVKRYHRYCEVQGWLAGPFVMQATTFLRDPDNFDNPWTPPTREEGVYPLKPGDDTEAGRARAREGDQRNGRAGDLQPLHDADRYLRGGH